MKNPDTVAAEGNRIKKKIHEQVQRIKEKGIKDRKHAEQIITMSHYLSQICCLSQSIGVLQERRSRCRFESKQWKDYDNRVQEMEYQRDWFIEELKMETIYPAKEN